MPDIKKIIEADKGLKNTDPLSELLYDIENEELEFLSTNCIPINLIFGGRPDGGIFIGGMSMVSADSQLGKSIIAANVMRNAQKKKMKVILIDTERAFKKETARKMGVDISPDKLSIFRGSDIEKIETIIMKIMDNIPIAERHNVLIVIDSWGTLMTSRAINNAITGNDKADFSLPVKKNNLANVCLNTGATFMIVNHIYDNVGGFGDPIKIPGGKRVTFNCENIGLCTSRSKEKSVDKKEVIGNIVKIKTYKSRFSIADTVLEYRIRRKGGLDPFYGMLPDALEHGCVVKSKPGKYVRSFIENDPEIKEKDLYTGDFWGTIYKESGFSEWLEEKYQFNDDNLVDDELEGIF